MNKDVSELLISEIAIGERFRKDVGDVSDLAQSIATVGQLQPVVITADNKLIAGLRRIRACEKIGLQSVLVSIATDAETARQLLIAERDENTCRKSFTIGEAVALGKALEELETPTAKARREASQAKEGNKLASKSESENGAVKITEPFQRKGDVRDVIGQAVGMSGPTYQRAKAVVEAASAPDASPEVIEAAKQMNETGKVLPAYKVVRSEIDDVDSVPKDIKSLGVGIRYATDAINCLKRIPQSDALRVRGMETVMDWITKNGGIE